MSDILILNQPFVSTGLGTQTFTIPTTGLYNVHYEVTEVPPSGISVVVKKNTVTQFTAPSVTTTQSAFQFKFGMSLAANDVIDVVTASSDAIDSVRNNVKVIVSIGQGL